MSKLSRVASALSFAHLTGFGVRGKRAEDEDDDKKGRRADDDMDEEDQDDKGKRGRRADKEDGDDRDDDKGKRGKRAEADPEDEEEDGDDESEGDDDRGKKGRKAKRAEDDEPEDDPDAEDEDDKEEARSSRAVRQARHAERARFAKIFSSRHAAGRVALAMQLACNTSMSSSQIIEVLRDAPKDGNASAERAARNPSLGSDGGGNLSRQSAIESRWDAAMKRAGVR